VYGPLAIVTLQILLNKVRDILDRFACRLA
jgi:hypothetical protein